MIETPLGLQTVLLCVIDPNGNAVPWDGQSSGGASGVTSVGLTAPSIFTVTNSPITTSGNIALSLNTQVANTVLAGPVSGIDAIPTFRALDPLDIPALAASKITSGVLDVARLGSGTPDNTKLLDGSGAWRTLVSTDIPTTLRATTLPGLTLSSTTSPITLNVSVGSSGQVLTSGGVGATPTWTTPIYVPSSGTTAQFLRGDNAWSNILVGPMTIGASAAPPTAVTLSIPIAPTATSNAGLISLGSGPFDGSTSGFFAGNSNGTHIAVNAASGYLGRMMDLQIAGVRVFGVGRTTVASGTSVTLNAIDSPANTVTITGNTAITTAGGFNYFTIGQPTYTAASAVAITNGATIAIVGPPLVSGSATLTNAYPFWVLAGTSRFDGVIQLGVGSVSANSINFGTVNTGIYSTGTSTDISIAIGGVRQYAFNGSNGQLFLLNNTASVAFGASQDLTLVRVAAASLQQGKANSATPVAQTFTIGESSRSGTDTNIAGASGTIRSGLGTGTGTVATLIFQTPTVAASGTSTQTYATRLTLDSTTATFTGRALVPDGSASAPTIGFSTVYTGATGIYQRNDGSLNFTATGLTQFVLAPENIFVMKNTVMLGWSSGDPSAVSADLRIRRITSASVGIGNGNNATPVANLLTIGESSRSGTDNNVAGANGTLRAGLGTGTGAGTHLALQSAIPTTTGTGTQSYGTGLDIFMGVAVLTSYIVAALPSASVAGAGATAFVTDANTTLILGLGLTVVGSGSNKVPVYSDGTNWIVG